MLLLKRIIPGVGAVLVAMSFWTITWRPLLLPAWVVILMSVIALATALMCGVRQQWREWWRLVLTPMIGLLGVALLALFLEKEWMIILWGMIGAGGFWWYLEQLFQFLHLPSVYKPYGLERASFLLQTLGIVGWAIGIFSLHLFVREYVALWGATLLWIAVVLVASDGALWMGKLEAGKRRLYTKWITWCLALLFLAHAWLPVHVFVQGVAMALWWFTCVSLCKADALQRLSRPSLRKIVLLATIGFILLFVTARWV